MCLGLPCDRCIAEHGYGKLTPTGRKLGQGPATQELPGPREGSRGGFKSIQPINLDFSEIEQRIVAALAAGILAGIEEHPAQVADLHRLRAAEIFDIKPSEVTDAQRRVGKTANFIDAYTHKEKRNG